MKSTKVRWITMILIGAFIAGFPHAILHAGVVDDPRVRYFDCKFYFWQNPDVAASPDFQGCGNAYRHYVHWGIKEGRSPNAFFAPGWYLDNHGDLKAAFGTDYTKALQHFITFGVKEGRAGSPAFSPREYQTKHPDLKAAYSENWQAYAVHWLNYGYREGRSPSNESGWKTYWDNSAIFTSTSSDIIDMTSPSKESKDMSAIVGVALVTGVVIFCFITGGTCVLPIF
jgi:hypothetical protein